MIHGAILAVAIVFGAESAEEHRAFLDRISQMKTARDARLGAYSAEYSLSRTKPKDGSQSHPLDTANHIFSYDGGRWRVETPDGRSVSDPSLRLQLISAHDSVHNRVLYAFPEDAHSPPQGHIWPPAPEVNFLSLGTYFNACGGVPVDQYIESNLADVRSVSREGQHVVVEMKLSSSLERVRLEFDPDKDFSLTRQYFESANGLPMEDVRIDFFKDESGSWLVSNVKDELYDEQGNVRMTTTLHVPDTSHYTTNEEFAAAHFSLPFPKGTLVKDHVSSLEYVEGVPNRETLNAVLQARHAFEDPHSTDSFSLFEDDNDLQEKATATPDPIFEVAPTEDNLPAPTPKNRRLIVYATLSVIMLGGVVGLIARNRR